MKFTLSWLKDHLDTDLPLAEILDRLTGIGLEVEAVDDRAAFGDFKIAKVLRAWQHPDADRLRVCEVDFGTPHTAQIVCGAPNARAGMIGVFAPVGSFIPGTDLLLKASKIRGQASNGMLCSERELMISDEHDGIIELSDDAPIGESYARFAGLDDPIIEIGVTPNRPDCFGVRGVARDLAAAGIGRFKDVVPADVEGTFISPVGITLNFPRSEADQCPCFFGRYVRNINNCASPAWMQRRLKAVGLRPINALVDITNYVSLDCGRPLHVYDADKLSGSIGARLGRAGEDFLALDGKRYRVDDTMCVIADDRAVLGLGGIMGGEETGCTSETKNVFIESAYFDPLKTAITGRKTGIMSDARTRFERGADPAFVAAGQALASKWINEICASETTEHSMIVKTGEAPNPERILDFPLAEVNRLTGLDMREAEIRGILTLLGFWIAGQGGVVKVAVPSWRPDVEGKADLVEEVMRIAGIDRVPSKPMPSTQPLGRPVLNKQQIRREAARRALAAQGLMEAVNWSFISEHLAALFGGVKSELRLANAMSPELAHMRPSLLPGLLLAAQRNANQGHRDIALFELGQVFLGNNPGDQFMVASGVRRGAALVSHHGRHWMLDDTRTESAGLFAVKSDALAALAAAGAPTARLQIVNSAPAWYHPGRCGTLQLGAKSLLAHFGELHPKVLKACDCAGPVWAFEAFPANVPVSSRSASVAKSALPKRELQAVWRDLAILVDKSVAADDVVVAARAGERKYLESVDLFDVFTGDGLPDGKKSIALSLQIQPVESTFTDDEIEQICAAVVRSIKKRTGGTLR